MYHLLKIVDVRFSCFPEMFYGHNENWLNRRLRGLRARSRAVLPLTPQGKIMKSNLVATEQDALVQFDGN